MAKNNAVPPAAECAETAETARAGAQAPQEAPGDGGSVPGGTGEPGPVLAIVDAARGLNLRSGPGRDHGVLTVLPDNSFVEILEFMGRCPDGRLYATEVPGWALVCRYQLPGISAEDQSGVFGGAGWVDRRFLVPVSAGETA